MATSVKVQVNLPADLVERLRTDARARGVGISTLVRMLVLASYERSDKQRSAA